MVKTGQGETKQCAVPVYLQIFFKRMQTVSVVCLCNPYFLNKLENCSSNSLRAREEHTGRTSAGWGLGITLIVSPS